MDGEREGFRDERTEYRRGHSLLRVGKKPVNDQRVWFNIDANWLDQNPPSPRPREESPGAEGGGAAVRGLSDPLLPEVPVDANQNPAGAFLDDHRLTVMGGFDRKVGGAMWSTTASISQNRQDAFRGFLTPPLDPGFLDRLGPERVFYTLPTAVEAFRRQSPDPGTLSVSSPD